MKERDKKIPGPIGLIWKWPLIDVHCGTANEPLSFDDFLCDGIILCAGVWMYLVLRDPRRWSRGVCLGRKKPVGDAHECQ